MAKIIDPILINGRNWSVSKKLKFVIEVHSIRWYVKHHKEIEEWLESEEHGKVSNEQTQILLYNEKQMQYFKLRWG